MAAGANTFYLTNGQNLSFWDVANEAVGSEKRCSMQGDASATSPFGFTVMSRCCIKDFIVTATATSGEVEFTRNGTRTGKKFVINANYIVTFAGDRKKSVPRFCFEPGVKYGMLQTCVGHA